MQQGAVMSLEEIVRGLTSGEPECQLEATQSARKILSRERHPPIDAMIQAGVVPVLVHSLERDDWWVPLPAPLGGVPAIRR